jgi:hypothetical protein
MINTQDQTYPMTTTAIDTEQSGPTPRSNCWCCSRGPDAVAGFVRLKCHAEVAICFDCLDWLVKARADQVRTLTRWGQLSWWQRLKRIYPGYRC